MQQLGNSSCVVFLQKSPIFSQTFRRLSDFRLWASGPDGFRLCCAPLKQVGFEGKPSEGTSSARVLWRLRYRWESGPPPLRVTVA